ncbi:MAG: hypothetical protein WD118_07335 [Phycisphaeraceae bacterium]
MSGYAGELRAALRRRKQSRIPRVRVRVGHREPRVLEASAESDRLLELARKVAGHGGTGGGKVV